MSKVEFIYFDLGKVIFEFDHQFACKKIAEQTGLTPDKVWEVLFGTDLEIRYETGLLDCDSFHKEFCDTTKTNMPQNEFISAIADVFEPNRKIFGLIAQLRACNFPIGILSNTCPAHWNNVCENYKIMRDFFKTTILSFESNSMKPDFKIYRDAIEQAGCSPEACFFVDDKQVNVDGAIACSIDAVLYTSVPKLVSDLERRGVQFNY